MFNQVPICADRGSEQDTPSTPIDAPRSLPGQWLLGVRVQGERQPCGSSAMHKWHTSNPMVPPLLHGLGNRVSPYVP
jgi:hypothetical protein